MTSILYICNPASIHDIKWLTFFAAQSNQYKVYVVGERQNIADFDTLKKEVEVSGATLLPSIETFSIRKPLSTIQSIRTLRQYCRQYHINLVHVLFASPHALWCNYLKTPYLITTRGSDILLVIPELLKGGYYARWLFGVFKKVFLNAAALTATSDKQAEKAIALFGLTRSPEVIRTGVDVERIERITNGDFLPELLAGEKFVFSPRYISPLYNTLFQLEAIEHLPQSVIDRFLFVFIRGRKFDEAYLQKVTARLNELQGGRGLRFTIINYLSQDAIWTCFKYAALTLNTPVSDGTPNSCLEAMAAGCPLIIPNIGYDKSLFSNNCFIYEPGNVDQLTEYIVLALSSYPQSHREKALADVRAFGNRTTEMNKLDKLYKGLTA